MMRSGNPALKDSTFLDLGSGTLVQSDAGVMTLNGTVNDNGASTTVTFEYGLTNAYGNSAAATTGGTVGAGAGVTAGSTAGVGVATG